MNHLSRFISWRDLIVKLFIKNLLLAKNQKNTVNYASTANQINSYYINSYYLTPSHAKAKLLYPLKHQLIQKAHAQLYSLFLLSSVMITKLLSACQVALTACFRNWKISYNSLSYNG